MHSLLPFSPLLIMLSFSQPNHSSQHPTKSPPASSRSLSLSFSPCSRIEAGACVLLEVKGLCEWPCERACAARTRRGVAKERVRRSGGRVDMAMWMMFWCGLWSWPPGTACVTGSVWEMGSALGRRQAAEKKQRKTKEAKAKINSKVPHLLFSFSFYSDIMCALKMSSQVFHFYLKWYTDPHSRTFSHTSLSFLSLSPSLWIRCYALLHIWLMRCWLKPWQNANVSFLHFTHRHARVCAIRRLCVDVRCGVRGFLYVLLSESGSPQDLRFWPPGHVVSWVALSDGAGLCLAWDRAVKRFACGAPAFGVTAEGVISGALQASWTIECFYRHSDTATTCHLHAVRWSGWKISSWFCFADPWRWRGPGGRGSASRSCQWRQRRFLLCSRSWMSCFEGNWCWQI